MIYGSVYEKTYEETERKRAELLQGFALQVANGKSEDAIAISEINRSVRDFYAVVPKGKNAFSEPLTDEKVKKLIPYIYECYQRLRLSICLALYMGLASDVLAMLKWSELILMPGRYSSPVSWRMLNICSARFPLAKNGCFLPQRLVMTLSICRQQ